MHDDTELVSRVLGGDRDAFDLLVTRYRASVYRQALRRVRDPQDAEEVTQNAFLKAYLNLGRLRRMERFDSWLRAITANESVSWLRHARPAHEGPDAAAGAADLAPSPEQALMEQEVRALVRRAIAALPEHERRIASAFYLEGSSYEEIQRRYGLTRSTIAGYLYRARRRLARRLGGLVSLTWLPGWESLSQTGLHLFGGPSASPVAKAAVATATVATVALVAGLVPSSHPTHPAGYAARHAVAISELRSVPAERGARHLSSPFHPDTVVGQPALAITAPAFLGAGVAEAAEIPPASPPLILPDKEAPKADARWPEDPDLTLQVSERTKRYHMEGGRLYVEEAGRRRPATDEEKARYDRALADLAAAKEQLDSAKGRLDAARGQLDAVKGQLDAARVLAERQAAAMTAVRPGGEDRDLPNAADQARRAEAISREARRSVERMQRRMQGDLGRRMRELQRLDSSNAAASRRADAAGRAIDAQAREIARQADAAAAGMSRRIERQAEEMARQVEAQANRISGDTQKADRRADEIARRAQAKADDAARQVDRQAQEIARQAEEIARGVGAQSDEDDAGPDAEDSRAERDRHSRSSNDDARQELRSQERAQQDLRRRMERMRSDMGRLGTIGPDIGDEVARMMDDLAPDLARIGDLAAQAGRLQQTAMDPELRRLLDQIRGEVSSMLRQVRPLIDEAARSRRDGSAGGRGVGTRDDARGREGATRHDGAGGEDSEPSRSGQDDGTDEGPDQ